MATLFAVIATLAIILLVILTVGVYSITSSLRSKFPRLWHDLGEPRWLTAEYLPPNRHLFTFLDSKRHLETQDQSFIQLCSTVRLGFYVFLLLMGTMILIGLAAVVLQSNPALHADASKRVVHLLAQVSATR